MLFSVISYVSSAQQLHVAPMLGGTEVEQCYHGRKLYGQSCFKDGKQMDEQELSYVPGWSPLQSAYIGVVGWMVVPQKIRPHPNF